MLHDQHIGIHEKCETGQHDEGADEIGLGPRQGLIRASGALEDDAKPDRADRGAGQHAHGLPRQRPGRGGGNEIDQGAANRQPHDSPTDPREGCPTEGLDALERAPDDRRQEGQGQNGQGQDDGAPVRQLEKTRQGLAEQEAGRQQDNRDQQEFPRPGAHERENVAGAFLLN